MAAPGTLTRPVPATTEDYPSLVACMDSCFIPADSCHGMAALNPHCVGSSPEQLAGYRVIKDGTRVVACLGCTPQELHIPGGTIRVTGLGQVATLPEYRGSGLMSQLLDDAIARMTQQGVLLSDLAGDRLRYARYGWEYAGRQWQFEMNARSMGSYASCPVRQATASPDDMMAIMAIHEQEPWRVSRDEGQYRRLLSRANREVWLALSKDRVVAYAVMHVAAQHCGVTEFGGDPEGVAAILQQGSTRWGSLVLWSPWDHACNSLFFRLASRWQVVTPRMLRLFDLEGVLRAYGSLLTERAAMLAPATTKPVTLEMVETSQRVTLVPGRDGLQLQSGGQGDWVVRLERREMTRLLFGPALPGQVVPLPTGCRWLDAVLPLDYMIWRNETV